MSAAQQDFVRAAGARVERASRSCGAAAALVACVTFVEEALERVVGADAIPWSLHGSVGGSVVTIVAGFTLARTAAGASARRADHVAGGLLVLYGILSLAGQWFGSVPAESLHLTPHPFGALAAVLLGAAVLGRGSARTRTITVWSSTGAGLLGALSLVGHVYGTDAPTGLRSLGSIPLLPAIEALLLAVSAMAALGVESPLRVIAISGPLGVVARRNVTAAVVVPVAIGGFAVAAARYLGFDQGAAVALAATSAIVAFVALGIAGALQILRADEAREEVRTALAERFRLEQILVRVSALAAESTPPRELVAAVAQAAFDGLAPGGVVALGAGPGAPAPDVLASVFRAGDVTPELPAAARVRTFAEHVFATTETAFVCCSTDGTDACNDACRAVCGAFRARSLLAAPIAGPAGRIGVLVAWWPERRAVAAGDAAFLRAVADAVAASIERTAAASALTASEERFREMAENISEIVWMTDPQKSEMLYVSPAFERIWGRPRDALYRDASSWIDHVHPGDREHVAAAIPSQRDGTYDVQYRVIRPDGTVRWVRDRASAIRDASGAVVRIVGTAADVTDLREAHDALVAKDCELRQSQKMEAIGRLAGGVAHDFNNLLTVMQGYAEMLVSQLPENDRRRPFAQEIVRSAMSATEMTSRLLAFSRQQLLAPEPVDLNAAIAALEHMLPRLVGEDVAIVTALDPSIGNVLADPIQIEQVLMNLAANARDAMPEGGRLTLATSAVDADEARAAELGLRTPGRWVELSVRDTGVGMEPDVLEHIFEPFFTTKGRDRGTGLGLATVYGIARQSGGHVAVESAPGRGTTFRIYLPVAQAEPEAQAAEPVPQRGVLQGGEERGEEPRRGSVLLVEDDDAVRSLARQYIESGGYDVVEAATPAEALAVAAAGSSIDLLVSDVVLPRMLGPDLALRIAAACPSLRALFVSGYGEAELSRMGTTLPEAGFLQKPYTRGSLLSSVRAAMAGPPIVAVAAAAVA